MPMVGVGVTVPVDVGVEVAAGGGGVEGGGVVGEEDFLQAAKAALSRMTARRARKVLMVGSGSGSGDFSEGKGLHKYTGKSLKVHIRGFYSSIVN
jgi:hypothetical protein